jgi:protein TonB
VAAVAAGVVVILLGVLAYFFWPADPTEAGTQAPPENAVLFPDFEPAPSLEEVGLLPATASAAESRNTAEPEPPAPTGDPKQEARLRADYERELAALRNQLRDAQRQAAETTAVPATVVASNQLPAGADALPKGIGRTTVVAPQAESESPVEDVSPTQGPGASERLETEAVDSSDETGSQVSPAPDPIDSDLVASAVETLAEQPEVARGDLVEPGPGVVAPQVVNRPQPRYPEAARRLGRTAVVVLRLLIDEQGNVAEIQQTGPKAGMGFDRAAVEAAESTSWQPAMVGEIPVRMWVELRIEFKP